MYINASICCVPVRIAVSELSLCTTMSIACMALILERSSSIEYDMASQVCVLNIHSILSAHLRSVKADARAGYVYACTMLTTLYHLWPMAN